MNISSPTSVSVNRPQPSEQLSQPQQKVGNLAGLSVQQAKPAGESPLAKSSGHSAIDSATHPATSAKVGAATGATELQVKGTASFRQSVAKDLAEFAPGTTVDSKGYVHAATTQQAGHQQGYQLINNLLNGKQPVTISFTSQNAFTQSGTGAQGSPTHPNVGSSAQVSYDPAWSKTVALPTLQKDGTSKDQPVDSAVVLAHELIHATHAQQGTIDRTLVDHNFTVGGQQYKENWRSEELRTTGFAGQRQGNEPSENSIRAELGFQPRTSYLFSNQWQRI